ncbi:unnamed protein product [Somion occarium]|uniref:Exocyst complex component EXO84 n=1 Tax=Somion occarium TaxID=3059160 RepID=A0ABP1CGV8_9APHY
MQSLRTRKPSESRPKGQGRKLAKQDPNLNLNRKNTRVDDKIKKRMSMRYADISSPTDASVPAVPSLPIGVRPGAYRGQDDPVKEREQPKEDPKETDLRMLDKDDFDPDAFLKAKLANSTEVELKSLQSSLQNLKDGVALDLQRNVFKNYAEFVLVSKEVSNLENEMLEFKDSLAEWKGMPSLLHIDDSASVAERRRNVRSSIADLRVLYAGQMQTLHSQIEGSNKFVPTTPGRHVITEMDGIYALNSATYKVDHSVRFVLLDDAALVAKKRRRRNNAESEKLIAERCWPLSEMLVLDTKDTASMINVFKIRHNKETHVYRTETAADKKSLLSQFRQIAEELSTKRQKEREGEHQRRKSLWRHSLVLGNDVPPMPDFLAHLADKADMGSSAKEKAERDARWVGDFTDELTVAIALRQWDQAVKLVEEGEGKLSIIPSLSVKLTPLKSTLTAALLQSLSSAANRKSIVVHLITLLLRLNAGAAARSTFLSARTEVMRKCIRMITFEGSIGTYIADLAIVVFTGIKHTADWFLASFKENEVASSFIEWAKQQIEIFAEMFRKQVFGPDVDARTVDEAIKVTHAQSKKLLEEFGLDFRFLLEDLLVEKPSEASRPPAFRLRSQVQPSPIRTPASTPIRSRSPAPNIAVPIPTRARSPPPSVPPLPTSLMSPTSTTGGQLSPASTSPAPSSPRVRSPIPRVPSATSTRPGTPSSESIKGSSRTIRGSPAPPPPRSRDRPGSAAGNRPPPVAIPRRDGMF